MPDATELTPASPKPTPVRFWTSLAVLAAVVFVYVLLVTSPGGGPGGTTGPAIGRRLEYLELEGLTGDARYVSLDDLRGKVTLLNYWGTWCPPCRLEFPDIVELYERFSDRDEFALYAVSCGSGSDRALSELREATEAFLNSRKVALPTYADPDGNSRQAMIAVLGERNMVYPTTLVLDRQGAIRGFWTGYDARAAGEMTQLIEQLLSDSGETAAVDPPTTD